MKSGELDLGVVGGPRDALAQRIRERKKPKRKPEDEFEFQLRAHKLPEAARNWMFAKAAMGRQWRFDFAFIPYLVAVEVEGLVVRRIGGELVVQGRHATVTGFREDCVKYASAALLGWTVLRFEQSQVKDGYALEMTQRVLMARGWARA